MSSSSNQSRVTPLMRPGSATFASPQSKSSGNNGSNSGSKSNNNSSRSSVDIEVGALDTGASTRGAGGLAWMNRSSISTRASPLSTQNKDQQQHSHRPTLKIPTVPTRNPSSSERRLNDLLSQLDLSVDDLDPTNERKIANQILKSYLNKWIVAYKNKLRKNRHINMKLALIVDRRVKRSAFNSLRSAFLAQKHFRTRYCQLYLTTWVRAYDLKCYMARKVRMTEKYHSLILKQKYIRKWVKLLDRRSKMMKYARLIQTWKKRQNNQLAKNAFIAWKLLMKHSKNRHEIDMQSNERKMKIRSYLERLNSATAAAGGADLDRNERTLSGRQTAGQGGANGRRVDYSNSNSDNNINSYSSNNSNGNAVGDGKDSTRREARAASNNSTPNRGTTVDSEFNTKTQYDSQERPRGYGMRYVEEGKYEGKDEYGDDLSDGSDDPPPYEYGNGSSRDSDRANNSNINNYRSNSNSNSNNGGNNGTSKSSSKGDGISKSNSNSNNNGGTPPQPVRKLDEIEARAKERRSRMLELKDKSKSMIQKKAVDDAEAQREKEMEAQASYLRAQNDKKLELDKLKRQNAKYLSQFQQQNQQRIESHNALVAGNTSNELLEKYNKAKRYYERMLVLKYGWSPLIKIVDNARLNLLKSFKFRIFNLIRSAFLEWYAYVDASKRERYRLDARNNAIAGSYFRRFTLRKVWKSWMLYRRFMRAKANSVSGHFSKYVIKKSAFKAWGIAFERSRRLTAHQLRQATPIGNRAVKRHVWRRWVAFLNDMRLDKEVRYRSAAAWERLQSYMKTEI